MNSAISSARCTAAHAELQRHDDLRSYRKRTSSQAVGQSHSRTGFDASCTCSRFNSKETNQDCRHSRVACCQRDRRCEIATS